MLDSTVTAAADFEQAHAGWTAWGDQSDGYEPDWPTYANARPSPRTRRPAGVRR